MTSPPVVSRKRGLRDLSAVVSWDVVTGDESYLYQWLYLVICFFKYFQPVVIKGLTRQILL